MTKFFRGEAVPSRAKKKQQQRISIKSSYSNTSYGFKYKKAAQVHCLLKYPLKEKPGQERPILTKCL